MKILVSSGANQSLDKIKQDNKITSDKDYCSFCGGFKSNMINHKVAHKLLRKLNNEAIPKDPEIEKELELLSAYSWYRQDKTKGSHLRPKDSRRDKYVERKSERDHKAN